MVLFVRLAQLTSKHHGEFTRVIGVVEPSSVIEIMGMEPTWEPNNPVTMLSPDTGQREIRTK